jgi:hypothetical protein
MRAGDIAGAIDSARRGIVSLGDDYASPDVEDDTGLNILLAESLAEEGREEQAAALLLNILEERIDLYKELQAERSAE